uniref:Uncharacterized protein n=1 Tax=Meloidogyne javanica TaxID=6303 RepID=A0A915LW41_MELJA
MGVSSTVVSMSQNNVKVSSAGEALNLGSGMSTYPTNTFIASAAASNEEIKLNEESKIFHLLATTPPIPIEQQLPITPHHSMRSLSSISGGNKVFENSFDDCFESEDSLHDEIVNSGIKSFISHRASKNLSGKISNFSYSDDPFITPPKQVVNKNVKKEAVLLKEENKEVKKEVLISKEKYILEQQNFKSFKSFYKNPLMTSSKICINGDEEKQISEELEKLKNLLATEGVEKGILEDEKNFLAKENENLKELFLEKCQENDNLKEGKNVSDDEAILYMRLSKVLLDNNKTLNDCLKTQQHMNTLLEKNAMEKGEIENVLQQLSVFNNNKKKANKSLMLDDKILGCVSPYLFCGDKGKVF